MAGKRKDNASSDLVVKKARPMDTTTIFGLNIDCLSEILGYLSFKDLFMLYALDKRFIPGIRLQFAKQPVAKIDMDFLRSQPSATMDDYLRCLGKTCQSMKFKLLPQETLLRILPLFTNLRELILSEIVLDGDLPEAYAALPTGLETLELDRCHLSVSSLDSWIPRLDETLTSLRITDRDGDKELPKNSFTALEKLTKITSLTLDGMLKHHHEAVGNVIANNKEQLTTLIMVHDGYVPVPDSVWQSILDLDKLNFLHLEYPGFDGTIPPGRRLFPNLTVLNLNFRSALQKSFIESLSCEESLQSLMIDDFSGTTSVKSLKRFKHLQNLELLSCEWNGAGDPKEIAELTQIRSLNLNNGVFNHNDDVLYLIKHMPWLQKLFLDNIFLFFGVGTDCYKAEKFEERIERICKKRKPHPLYVEITVTVP